MLYIFHGSDIDKSRKRAHNLVDSLRAKRPDASYAPIDADNWHPSIIEGHIAGQGLFSSKYIIFLDRVTESEEARETIADFLPSMNESSNIFVILEGRLTIELDKAFDKNAEKVVVSDLSMSDGPTHGYDGINTKDFNIFSLADAVGGRNSIKSWMIYRQAVDRGIELESIIGTMFWQVKSMVMASDRKSAAEAGLSPFVFSKSKKFAANYSTNELTTLLTRVVTLYHDGHRGLVDLELGAERLLLGL